MTHTPHIRILLVDDNDVGRYALSRLLRREGFDVTEAATGHEALRLAAAGPQPDLIILDVKLPDMSGLTVCHALKQQPATAHLPVLQQSAVYVQESDKVQGLESGADAYLTGPVEPPVLLATVRALLRVRHAEATLREVNATLEQRVAERTAALQREMVERQQIQAALFQSEKLAAMGSLLASVAHELNNPLSIILLYTTLLQDDAGPGPLAEYTAEITQAATRCERLVRQFLTLARQHAPERAVVDFNALLTETMDLLAPSLRVDTITVDLRLAAEITRLWADPHQLQQVVVNLITNAQQALRDVAAPRHLTLTTGVDAARTRVTLEVADTGLGMSPDVQARIFEPFFTTKAPGVGTGLGLPLCRSIIEEHGGTLRCTSQAGQGTTFWVELPVGSIPETSPASTDRETVLPPVPGSSILLVDDEPSIITAMTRLLRRDGHTVDTAANGRLALMKLQERTYDVILSDLRMPELDGPGLYRALETHYPQLCQRFIFLTGDTLNPDTQALGVQHGVPQLFKPYTAADLRRVIHQVLQAV
jgi:signal transduction histidine kinase